MKTRQLISGLLAAAIMSIGIPTLATAAAAPEPAPAAQSAAPAIAPGPYVSPWGDAQVVWDPAFKALLDQRGITTTPIAPVKKLPGDSGVISDIGWTSGDYIDLQNFGRVYYPGGWTFTDPASGGTWTLNEFWLRFFPTQGLSGYPVINGTRTPGEQLFTTYTLGNALTGGGGWGFDPSRVGVKTAKVPLSLTQQGADGLNQALNTSLRAGDTLGVLSGTFRYLP